MCAYESGQKMVGEIPISEITDQPVIGIYADPAFSEDVGGGIADVHPGRRRHQSLEIRLIGSSAAPIAAVPRLTGPVLLLHIGF